MPTRLYFDDNTFWDGSGTNPLSPSYHPGWHEDNSAQRVKLVRGKPGNAFSQVNIQKNVAGAPRFGLSRVYVSEPLPKSFTLSGTVKGQISCNESNSANNEMRALVIRVWNPGDPLQVDSGAFRTPTVLVHHPTTLVSEFQDIGAQNRFFPPEVPVTPINIHSGDRLVIETGITFFNTGTGAGIQGLLRTGNPAGSVDLPEDEVYTVPEAAPWIEFSMDFPDGAPKSFSQSVPQSGGAGITPGGGLDYLFELVGPDGARYDVTDRTSIDGLSRIQLTVERNLHDFRAGDVSVTFDDGDGFFSDLFRLISPSDRWRLNIDRDGVRHFTGFIPGIDSIRFDRKQELVEVTALDLSKLLEDVDAETVARPDDIYTLGADVTATDTTITLNSTAGLFNGDTFSLTDDATNEEFTIALVLDGTDVMVTQAASNGFMATDTIVKLITKFHRFKTPEFLINELLDAAGDLVSGRSISLTAPPSRLPIFSDMSTNRLPGTSVPNAMLQKDGKQFARISSSGSFEQSAPDEDWISAGTDRKWIDWTPYRTQEEGEPTTFATAPGVLNTQNVGVDLTVGALVVWEVRVVVGFNQQVEIDKYTSTDGITWSARTFVSTLGDTGGVAMSQITGDYDSVRNRFYYQWESSLAGTHEFGYWDVAGSVKIVLDTSENRRTPLTNIRYVREFDGLVVYNSTQDAIEVWRDSAVVLSYGGEFAGTWSPKTTRYLNGAWFALGYPQGNPSVFFSDNDLETVTQIKLSGKPTSGTTGRRLTIVNGTIRVAVNGNPEEGTIAQARYFIGASGFAGTIPYADFEGQSVINSMDDLAILLNGVFWMDTDGVAHFALRGIGSSGDAKEIDDLVVERSDELVWLELYDYVEFRLPNDEIASAGKKTSTSRNLSIELQMVTSFSVATAASLYILDFFEKRRQHTIVSMEDDNRVYGLLDIVTLDGINWIVYSVDRDLSGYEIGLELVEKVEA